MKKLFLTAAQPFDLSNFLDLSGITTLQTLYGQKQDSRAFSYDITDEQTEGEQVILTFSNTIDPGTIWAAGGIYRYGTPPIGQNAQNIAHLRHLQIVSPRPYNGGDAFCAQTTWTLYCDPEDTEAPISIQTTFHDLVPHKNGYQLRKTGSSEKSFTLEDVSKIAQHLKHTIMKNILRPSEKNIFDSTPKTTEQCLAALAFTTG